MNSIELWWSKILKRANNNPNILIKCGPYLYKVVNNIVYDDKERSVELTEEEKLESFLFNNDTKRAL